MSEERDRYHVYPTYSRNRSTHWTGKKGFCWCDPEELQVCPESPLGGQDCPETCPVCKGRGLIAEYDPALPLVYVHRQGQLGDHLPAITVQA
jgi:hypothetical protein